MYLYLFKFIMTTEYFTLQDNIDNNKEEQELIIFKIPSKLMDNKVQTKIDNLFKQRKRKYNISYNDNNNNKKIKTNYKDGNMKNYFETLNRSTEKCIDIFINNFGIKGHDIYEGRNIYCPFHENKRSSNSPSAKFRVNDNYYQCFSTNCPLRKNSNSKISTVNSITLFKKISSLLNINPLAGKF